MPITGYCFLDEVGWQPPPAMLKFLEEGDQPFWAERARQLHAGTCIDRLELNAASLSEAIRLVSSDVSMQASCRALANRIRAENGAERAASILDNYLREKR